MKFFWLIFNQGTVNSHVADVVHFGARDPGDLLTGLPIEDWSADASLKVGPNGRDGVPDDVLQIGAPVPVFSERLQRTVEEARLSTIQYLPVRCLRANGHDSLGVFYVANLLDRIPALDLSRSEIRRYPADYFLVPRRGAVASIRRPVLCAASLAKVPHLFRADEFPRYVFASERMRDLFRLGRFTGVEFSPVEVSGIE